MRAPKPTHQHTSNSLTGGTAGCLIANRLSVHASVLVLDKGRVNAGLLSRIPLLGPLQGGINRYHAEPNANLRGRHVQLLAGEMLGGTSRIHSMVWSPGGRAEFDGWARDLGLDDWGWGRVEPALWRVEGGVKRRQAGDTGLMPFVDSVMGRVGLGDGERGTQRYARSELSIDGKGERSSALTSWLDAGVVKERGGRLKVCTGVLATKLEFGDEGTSVTGVWIRPASGGADVLVKAQREVIVCSGVFGTPQLLMLRFVSFQLIELAITYIEQWHWSQRSSFSARHSCSAGSSCHGLPFGHSRPCAGNDRAPAQAYFAHHIDRGHSMALHAVALLWDWRSLFQWPIRRRVPALHFARQ